MPGDGIQLSRNGSTKANDVGLFIRQTRVLLSGSSAGGPIIRVHLDVIQRRCQLLASRDTVNPRMPPTTGAQESVITTSRLPISSVPGAIVRAGFWILMNAQAPEGAYGHTRPAWRRWLKRGGCIWRKYSGRMLGPHVFADMAIEMIFLYGVERVLGHTCLCRVAYLATLAKSWARAGHGRKQSRRSSMCAPGNGRCGNRECGMTRGGEDSSWQSPGLRQSAGARSGVVNPRKIITRHGCRCNETRTAACEYKEA